MQQEKTTARNCEQHMVRGCINLDAIKIEIGSIYCVSGISTDGAKTTSIFCVFCDGGESDNGIYPSISVVTSKKKSVLQSLMPQDSDLSCTFFTGNHFDIFLKVTSIVSQFLPKKMSISTIMLKDANEKTLSVIADFNLSASILDSFTFFSK